MENDGSFQNVVIWTPCKYQGIGNKWYNWSILVDAKKYSRGYILPVGVKHRFVKNYIFITWHGDIFQFCYPPPPSGEDVAFHFKTNVTPLPKEYHCQN